MHVPRTAKFDEEAERYSLRFCCEDCGHFDPVREVCRHEWPVAPHRRARYQARAAPGDEVVFCKEFEQR
jgi:hypothetical protein